MIEFKCGKKPAIPGAVALRFGTYFNEAQLPTVPLIIGKPWLIDNWRMLGNDTTSDCVQAGAAHETMQIVTDAGYPVPLFTPTTVLADYRAINPNDPHYRNGTTVAAYAAYRRKTGILDASGLRHKIDVYTALRPGDTDQLSLATFLFGVAGVGVALPYYAHAQFQQGEIWDVQEDTSGKNPQGHYIPCVGRNSKGHFLFVTWGRIQAATAAWVQTYMDEGLAVFSRERLNVKGLSPQGYDAAALNADFEQVTA